MRTALMVAEKPSLAKSIAQILSNGSVQTRKSVSNACPVHEFIETFNGEATLFKMTSVCGHVMALDFIPKYNSWDKVDPIELFEATTKKKLSNPELHIPQLLQKEGLGCDYLILWLDCDKEGENICYEVLDIVRPQLRKWYQRESQAVFRAKFSALTEREIHEAMSNLGQPNLHEARAVDARQELDLRVGCAFTRFQTKYFQGKYSNLDSTLISFGPCQTPTLGFCVERYDKIQNFKPEPYWLLHVEQLKENCVCQIQSASRKAVSLEWQRGAIFDVEVARYFLNNIKNVQHALVTSVKTKESVRPRPLALNTVELMRVASSGLGMGPQHTMQLAEKLYTQGYISYPRTETTSYPDSFDLKEVLHHLRAVRPYSEAVQDLLSSGINRPRKGHDAGDHPPITPLKAAQRDDLDGNAWKIYDYISRHFIATLCEDMVFLQTTVQLEVGEEKFSCQGMQLLERGFTAVFPWQAPGPDDILPPLEEGSLCPILEMKLLDKMTQPPDYLTEAELITLMEKHGIGTDASIPTHINNICERHYVTVESGRRLKPTKLGLVLVQGYNQIDQDLVLPTMRAAVERQLNLIAHGKADFHQVLKHGLNIFLLKFVHFVTSIFAMDDLFSQTFMALADSGRPFTRCGKCRRFLKLTSKTNNQLHCQICHETLALPRGGNIREFKEYECPLDGYQLVHWSEGPKAKFLVKLFIFKLSDLSVLQQEYHDN
ncbi:TOP3B [Cordylochernes scorpioides]|uniref:DNA topoisomerase n=1 Tax=Cordylochernes scorpioides TaxID=51811 RepID=A0ABY6KSW5_9ARAC|nr:TOP3B [Cordylochernes scorpioides]